MSIFSANFKEIMHWKQHMFEKLAWVFVGVAKGKKEKGELYLDSVKELLQHIDDRIAYLTTLVNKNPNETFPQIQIHDLQEIRKKVVILQTFATTVLGKLLSYTKEVNSSTHKGKHEMKYIVGDWLSLHHWYVSAMKKLGWMVLAHARGDKKRVEYYVNQLHDIKCNLKNHEKDYSPVKLIMFIVKNELK